MPSIFVRPDGEADVAVQGPDFSLTYYWAMPGSAWRSTQIAGARDVYSVPSLVCVPTAGRTSWCGGPTSR